MENKETGIEYLERIVKMGHRIDKYDWVEAKKMDKERMIRFAFDFYYDFSCKTGVPINLISENRDVVEQYYNEVFESIEWMEFLEGLNKELNTKKNNGKKEDILNRRFIDPMKNDILKKDD